MGKEVSVFGCDNRLDEYRRDILVRGVFAVCFIKKNSDYTVPIIGIDRTLRKNDSIDGPPLYMVLGGSSHLDIERKKINGRYQD